MSKKQEAPKYKLIEGHQLKEAFTIGNKPYYEFSDSHMAPCARMFAALTFYEEFKMRCTRDYLIAHCTAIEEQLNGQNGTIDFLNVAKLHLQLKERLEWIHEPETAYKYASVIFFNPDEEDPYDYNIKFGMEKIAYWKQQQTPESFFLSMPVKRLFPLLDLSNEDLQAYLKVQEKLKKEHLEVIFGMLSEKHQTKDFYKSLDLLRNEVLV